MCNKMHKLLIAAAAGLMASSAMAYDGKIEFTGEITAASCKINGGSSPSQGDTIVNVNLGKVSKDSLGGATASSGNIAAAGEAITLNLDCSAAAGLSQVKVAFDPGSGSGLDSKNQNLLKTTGAAKGVGIGIFKADGTLLNLGAGETFDAALTAGTASGGSTPYTANLSVRAAYVSNGETLVPGAANGTLPFTLTYE